ncbi:MAG: hypothetical protein GY895_19670 [Phycisphaera sp.]|nr:hypothetical protein [Phycisphaera sp.]
MKKMIKRTILGLLVLLVLGLVGIYFTLNTIAASEIESAATDALGVETTVEAVNIGLFKGRSSLRDLEIDNPPGYEGKFLVLKSALLGVSLGTIFSDLIDVKEVSIEGISLDLVERLKESNIGTILSNANNDPSDTSASDDPSSGDSGSDGGDDQKFIIDLVSVKDIEIKVAVEPVTSERQPTTIKIDEIVIHDIGRKENGVTLDELSAILVRSIVGSAVKAAPGQIPSLLMTTMEGGLSSLTHFDLGGVQIDLGKGLSTLMGKVHGVTHGGGEEINEAVKNVGKGIEEVLGESKGSEKEASDKDSRK